uniref:Rev protein n=1 Tax=Simian immunodeficiency virus TaxID=11723 RepID=F4N9Q1_SIV|nr:Rev protein [Simian immunodeficiency virus]
MSTGGDLNQYLKISRRLLEGKQETGLCVGGSQSQTHRQRRRRRSRERRHIHQLRALQERIFTSTLDSGLGRAFTRLSVSDPPEVAEGLGNCPGPEHLFSRKLPAPPVCDFLPAWATPLENPQRLDGSAPCSSCALDQEHVQNQQGEHITRSGEKQNLYAQAQMED